MGNLERFIQRGKELEEQMTVADKQNDSGRAAKSAPEKSAPEKSASERLMEKAASQQREQAMSEKRTVGGQAAAIPAAVGQGLLGGVSGLMQGADLLWRGADAPKEGGGLFGAGEAVNRFSQKYMPVPEEYQGTLTTDLAQGVGSFGSYMLGGGVGGAIAKQAVSGATRKLAKEGTEKALEAASKHASSAARKGQMTAAVGMAAPAGTQEAYQRAKEFGLSDEEALEHKWLATIPGAIQVAPVAFLLRPFSKSVQGTAFKALGSRLGVDMASESIAEGAGAVGQNIIEKFYNPNTGVFDDVGYRALLGGMAAGVIQSPRALLARLSREDVEKIQKDISGLPEDEQGEALAEVVIQMFGEEVPVEQQKGDYVPRQGEGGTVDLGLGLGLGMSNPVEGGAPSATSVPQAGGGRNRQTINVDGQDQSPEYRRTVSEIMQDAGAKPVVRQRRKETTLQRLIREQREGAPMEQDADLGEGLRALAGIPDADVSVGPPASIETSVPARQTILQQMEAESRAPRGKVDINLDDVATAVAKLGGLAAEHIGGELDAKDVSTFQKPGSPIIRKTGGRTPDAMAEALNELGYTDSAGNPIDPNNLMELLRDNISGRRVFSSRSNRESMIDPDNAVAKAFFDGDRKKVIGALKAAVEGRRLGRRQELALEALDDLVLGTPETEADYGTVHGEHTTSDAHVADAVRVALAEGASSAEVISLLGKDLSPAEMVGALSSLKRGEQDNGQESEDALIAYISEYGNEPAIQPAAPEEAYVEPAVDSKSGPGDTETTETGEAETQPEVPGSVGGTGIRGVLESRVDRNAPGLTPQQRDAVVDLLMQQYVDTVTGWTDARGGDIKSAISDEVDSQVAGGQQIAFTSMDLANLGGLNDFYKNISEDSNRAFREIMAIVADQFADLPVIGMRTGGDELGLFAVGIAAQEAEARMEKARELIHEYAKKHGFDDIKHSKGKPTRGVSVYSASVDLSIEMAANKAYRDTEARMKEMEDARTKAAQLHAEGQPDADSAGGETVPGELQPEQPGGPEKTRTDQRDDQEDTAEAEGVETSPTQTPQTPADAGVSVSGDITPAHNVPDSVLSAFPDMMVSTEGLIILSQFSASEIEALEAAGLIETETNKDGQEYRGVNPEMLWPLRQERAKRLKAERRQVTDEERNAGIEKRAAIYDRLSDEQEQLGDLGDLEKAAEYRKKAAEIRAKKSGKKAQPPTPDATAPQQIPADAGGSVSGGTENLVTRQNGEVITYQTEKSANVGIKGKKLEGHTAVPYGDRWAIQKPEKAEKKTLRPDASTAPVDEAAQKEVKTPESHIDRAEPIEDFGEKIEGARKDLAATMKAAMEEDVTAVPLSKSWPEQNYQKMLDDGIDPWVVAAVRAFRDEVPAKPRRHVKRWAEQVETLRGLAFDLIEGKKVERVKSTLKESGPLEKLVGRIELYETFGHDNSFKGIGFSKQHWSIRNGERDVTLWVVEQYARKSSFGNMPREIATGKTKQEALDNFRKVIESGELNSSKNAKNPRFDVYSYRAGPKSGKWYIGKKIGRNHVDLESFDTSKEAIEYLRNNADKLADKLAKLKDIPAHRMETNSPRVGVDHRNGQDVTPEMFSESFGFRGVQFGNYVEQGKRQQDLNEAYDALMDMAGVIGVPARALSLNGELGLAFGARGKGKRGKITPAAHYESDHIVINLTKKSGAGSLAHEWWHALDNYFTRERGAKGDRSFATEGAAHVGVRNEVKQAFREVTQAINRTRLKQRSRTLDSTSTKEYWSTGREMSARSFESYVIEKLREQGASNDYLANIVSKDYWDAAAALGLEKEGTYPYPEAAEIPEIRAAFDNFFQVVEAKETGDGNVALFSLAEDDSLPPNIDRRIIGDDPVLLGWTMLARNDDVFRLKTSNKKSVPAIIKDLIARSEVTAVNKDFAQAADADAGWEIVIRAENGDVGIVHVFQKGKSVWLDVSALSPGQSGSEVYNAIANYAFNTDRVLIGDPAGLSDVALSRRLENMISSALKFGTTRHLWPHGRQVKGDSARQPGDDSIVRGITWKDGDDVHNLRQMIGASYQAVRRQFPEIWDLRYNPESDVFEDVNTGKEWTRDDFNESARKLRAGASGQHHARGTSGVGGAVTAGGTTLERAVFTQTLLSAESGEVRRALLERLGSLGSERLVGILYSQSSEARPSAGLSGFGLSDPAPQARSVAAAVRKALGGLAGRVKVVQSVADLPRISGLERLSTSAPVFYSQLLRTVQEGRGAPRKASAEKWKSWLDGRQRSGDLKKSERDWTGIDAWLDGHDGNISREAVVNFVLSNEVRIIAKEKTDGPVWRVADGSGTNEYYKSEAEAELARSEWIDNLVMNVYEEHQISQERDGTWFIESGYGYTVEDGIESRQEAEERADELNEKLMSDLTNSVEVFEEDSGPDSTQYSDYTVAGLGENYKEILLIMPHERAGSNRYNSVHWNEKNVLAHARFDERIDTDGKRVLMIHEIQSDWHQDGRKAGYASKGNKAASGVPDAPFKQTDEWAMLVLKRMVRHAAENDIARVAWPTGEQVADVFDLSKKVKGISWSSQSSDRSKIVTITLVSGNETELRLGADGRTESIGGDVSGVELVGKHLRDIIGKDLAESIMGSPHGNLSGDGVKVGGSGMMGFYDKILPSAVNKWGKKFGAKVGETTIEAGGREEGQVKVHAFDVTPAMRDAAMQGQPLFSSQRSRIEGMYDPASDQIYLVADGLSNTDRAVWVAWHELFHRGVRQGQEGQALRQSLNRAGLNKSINQLANAIAKDRGLTPDQRLIAVEEALAELNAADETGNYDQIQRRYGVTVPDGMKQGIRGHIARFVEAVKNALNKILGREITNDAEVWAIIRQAREGYDAQSGRTEGEMAASVTEDEAGRQFEETAKAYGGKDAWQKAKKSGKTNLNYNQWVQVRTPNFKRWFGDWDIASATLKRNASTFAEARERAKAFQGKPLTNAATGIVATVSRNNLDKMLSDRAVGKSETPAIHSRAVANLDNLFSRAILGWSKPDAQGDPNIKAIHRFFAPVLIDGRAMLAKVTVKETVDPNHANGLYTVETVTFEAIKSPAAQWVDAAANADGIDLTSTRSAGPVRSMAQGVQDFNPDAVSKVIDPATGEPLVVYHGGSVGNVFSAEHAGKGGGREAAFFFTPDRRQAKDYAGSGSVKEAFLVLKWPAETDVQLDLNEVEQAKVKGNDGYWLVEDGLVEESEIAVFSPNQIKSATGNTGDFSAATADIRFSLAPSEETYLPSTGPRIERGIVRLAKLKGWFMGAADTLLETKGLEHVGEAVREYFDGQQANRSKVAPHVLKVKGALKNLSRKDRKAAHEVFAEHRAAIENGRDAESVLSSASEKVRGVVQTMIEEWQKIADISGDMSRDAGVMVYDAEKKLWRPMGKAKSFWPRSFSEKVEQALDNPHKHPEMWRRLVEAIYARGEHDTMDDAANYLVKYRAQLRDSVADNDYFAGIEKGRTEPLPEIFYDYSWDAGLLYTEAWADRLSQIRAFGQAYGENKELFGATLDQVTDHQTEKFLIAARDRVYNRKFEDMHIEVMQTLNAIATGIQLGNPATALLNVLGGSTLNMQAYGMHAAKEWAKLATSLKYLHDQMRVAKEMGILQEDHLQLLHDSERSGTPKWLRSAVSAALKYGGYTPMEYFIRTHAMLSGKAMLRDALDTWNTKPGSKKAAKYARWFRENNFDMQKLIVEGGQGEYTDRFIRYTVNLTQGSYRIDQTPIFVDTQIGRFLWKYQKFGTQLTRMFWKNHLKPFTDTLTGNNKETYTIDGQEYSARLYHFMPLLRFFAMAAGAGMLIMDWREELFGYQNKAPTLGQIDKALQDDDTAKAVAYSMERGWQGFIALGGVGFFTNYWQLAYDVADRQRVKSPLSPPALAPAEAVMQLVLRAFDQGELTGRDFDRFAQQSLSLYRTTKRATAQADAALGHVLPGREMEIQAVMADMAWARKVSRRFAAEVGIEAKRRAMGNYAATENTPINTRVTEALMVGDSVRARELVRDHFSDRKRFPTTKERQNAMLSLRSSIRSRDPSRVGASPSERTRQEFLRWARTNLSAAEYARLLRVTEEYRRSAQRAGLL